MKVLLIQTPIEDFYSTKIRTFPLGIILIYTYLVKKGINNVKIFDFLTGYKDIKIPIPFEFKYLEKFYLKDDRSPIKLFSNYYHFGERWENIEKIIRNEKPDVVGISSLFTPYYRESLKCAEITKKVSGTIKVVLGGNHPSLLPEEILKDKNVDYVIVGEGEIPFYKLLKHLDGELKIEEVENLCYKVEDEIKCNEKIFLNDIEISHPMDLSSLNSEKYKRGKKKYVFIESNRGCPFNCEFCALKTKYGKNVKFRRPENVLKEMEILKKKYGVEIFDFTDDYLIFFKKDFKELLKKIINSKILKGIEICATNGIPLEKLDFEVLKLMKKAGFKEINISLVSARQENLLKMGRPSNVKMFEKIYPEIVNLDFFTTVYLILGLEGESVLDVLHSLFFLIDKKVLIGPSILYAVPGTSIFEKYSKTTPFYFLRSSTASTLTENFSTKSLLTLFSISRLINFIKSKVDEDFFVLQKDIKFKKISEFLYEFPEGKNDAEKILLHKIFTTFHIWGYKVMRKNPFRVKFFERNEFDEEVLNKFFERFKISNVSGIRKFIKLNGGEISDYLKNINYDLFHR